MGTWKDPAITESSGLACSLKWANKNYAYVHNDEPGPLYVVNLATGQTVGSIGIRGVTLFDDESIRIDKAGRLWWADIGDNDELRPTPGVAPRIAIYSIAEPGPGSHGNVPWTKHIFQYPGDTAHNAEALVVWPNKLQIVTKVAKGVAYDLPKKLATGSTVNVLKAAIKPEPRLDFVTDAVAQWDGRYVFVIRKDHGTTISVFTSTWAYAGAIPMPNMTQPEGLALDRDGHYLWVCNDNGAPGGKYQRVTVPTKYRPKAPNTPTTPTTPTTPVVPPLSPCQG